MNPAITRDPDGRWHDQPSDAATLGRMIDLGVDGLITDRPDVASRWLTQRGIQPR